MSKNKFLPLSRKRDLVTQEVGNEILIYDLTINKAFNLNQTSSLVWQACDGKKSIDEISNQISKQLGSPVNEEFVWFALEQLKKENLIEDEIESITPFEGLSRREVIWKIGLASVVALPIISSLIAPISVSAASCVNTNLPCNPTGTFCPTTATPILYTDCCSCTCNAASGSPSRSRCA